jgi:hypothetical protein
MNERFTKESVVGAKPSDKRGVVVNFKKSSRLLNDISKIYSNLPVFSGYNYRTVPEKVLSTIPVSSSMYHHVAMK